MGLDIYLSHSVDFKKSKRKNDFEGEGVELDSKLHPDHDCFKIGYFRSSYNDSGIDRVLDKMGLPTLYDIFPHKDNSYQFTPDWAESLKIVNKTLVAFNHATNGLHGKYDCYDIAAVSLFTGPGLVKDARTALKVYENELKTEHGFKNYSSRQGTFYSDPQIVRAFIPGLDVLGQPCLYVVTERSKSEGGEDVNLKWYREALEIVRETIEYVLAQKDPQNYYLSWSG